MLNETMNCRVTLYGRQEGANDLDERTYDYAPIKTLWAEILPTGGNTRNTPGGMVYAEITHKFTIRAGSAPELANDMYFLFGGQRYDIKFFMPNFRSRDRVEIHCRLVVE